MKITKEHYGKLEFHIKSTQRYVDSLEDYLGEGLSEKRYRWDVFWVANRLPAFKELIREIYQYANDDHIDTALRKITNTK